MVIHQIIVWRKDADIQEFTRSSELKLVGNSIERRSANSGNPIRYSGSLLSTVKSIRQCLEENEELTLRNMSDFVCSVDGERFLRNGHRGMKRLCFFRGEMYRKSFLKYLVFSLSSFHSLVLTFFVASRSVTDGQFSVKVIEMVDVTHVALLAGMDYLGIAHPAMLFISGARPLTDDEAFLISLVRARSADELLPENARVGYQRLLHECSSAFVQPAVELFHHKACTISGAKPLIVFGIFKCFVVAVLPALMSMRRSSAEPSRSRSLPGTYTRVEDVKVSDIATVMVMLVLLFLVCVVFVIFIWKAGRSSIQEFVRSGEVQLANRVEYRSGNSDNPFKYTGSLLLTVKSIRQGLEENEEEAWYNMSDFFCSADGARFIRDGHEGMKRLCFFRGDVYRKSDLKFIAFSFCSLLCWGWTVLATFDASGKPILCGKVPLAVFSQPQLGFHPVAGHRWFLRYQTSCHASHYEQAPSDRR